MNNHHNILINYDTTIQNYCLYMLYIRMIYVDKYIYMLKSITLFHGIMLGFQIT